MVNEAEQSQANTTQPIGRNCKNATEKENKPNLGSIITLI
jgi:hypothetical protein